MNTVELISHHIDEEPKRSNKRDEVVGLGAMGREVPALAVIASESDSAATEGGPLCETSGEPRRIRFIGVVVSLENFVASHVMDSLGCGQVEGLGYLYGEMAELCRSETSEVGRSRYNIGTVRIFS
jgi:hypothetical protein